MKGVISVAQTVKDNFKFFCCLFSCLVKVNTYSNK